MAKRKIMLAANRVNWRDLAFLSVAVACAWFGLSGFLLPSGFLDGGVTGVALIARQLSGRPLSILILLINIPFIIMGRYQISLIFAAKTLCAIGVLALVLWQLPIEPVTLDPLLVAVFGGFFLGAGIGLAMRGGGVIDGTEVLALYLARHTPLSIGHVILVINVTIFAVAALVFNVEAALYAMLTYLAASKTVNTILHGFDDYMAVTITSDNNAAIIHKVLSRSMKLNIVTATATRGDPSRPDKAIAQPILYTVVSRLQIQQILDTVNTIDRHASIAYHPVTDFHGKF